MKIGFEFIFDEAPLLISVAEKIRKEHNAEIVGLTLGNRWEHLLRRKSFRLISLSGYLREHWNNYRVSKEEVSKLEEEYGGEHNLWWFIDVDRFLHIVHKDKFFTKDDRLKFLCLHFKFWEFFFNEYSPQSFYTTGVSFLCLLTGMAVAQKKGIDFKSIVTTRFAEPRIVFINNYLDEWKDVNKLYEEILGSGLSSETFNEGKKFIENFRRIPQRPSYTKIRLKTSGINRSFFLAKEFFRRLKFTYINGWGKDRFDYVTPHLFKRVIEEIEVFIKKKLLGQFYFKRKALKKSGNDQYVFLSLQVQPEAACDIHGMYYSNQIAFVENVAKSLPLDLKLYVKEHPAAVGKRKGVWRYYREINKLTNVELIHPFADTYEFIKNAKIIIVSSGTMGWEALLFRKPVIVFGEVFYKHSNLVYKANSFGRLKSIIKKILNSKEILPKDYDEKLIKFVCALKNKTFPGYFAPYYCGERDVLSSENIEKMSSAILKDCGMLR